MHTKGRLNNRHVALKGLVALKKQKLNNIKGTDEKYELKQLSAYNTQLLKYNLMGSNVEGIYNVYLQHHPIKVNT